MGLLITAGRVAEKELERQLLLKFKLTFPQYQVLEVLWGEGQTKSPGDLADAVGCSRGNLTGVADRLERDGWILRERSKTDRRVVDIRLLKEAEFTAVARWMEEQPQPPATVTEWLEGFIGQRGLVTA